VIYVRKGISLYFTFPEALVLDVCVCDITLHQTPDVWEIYRFSLIFVILSQHCHFLLPLFDQRGFCPGSGLVPEPVLCRFCLITGLMFHSLRAMTKPHVTSFLNVLPNVCLTLPLVSFWLEDNIAGREFVFFAQAN